MKRSEINTAITRARAMMRTHRFCLPPFADDPPDVWQNDPSRQDIISARLGWDVTDFNLGDFARFGLTLFTLRNQSAENGKPYAEKIMVVGDGQITPLHYHWQKMEDIINRGGGTLVVQLYRRDEKTDLRDEHAEVDVRVDGKTLTLPAGGTVRLREGESICLPPLLYHAFWAENGAVLAGEVSTANDDLTDNRFLEPLGRFSHIEEDEPPLHLLCSDYSHPLKS